MLNPSNSCQINESHSHKVRHQLESENLLNAIGSADHGALQYIC